MVSDNRNRRADARRLLDSNVINHLGMITSSDLIGELVSRLRD